jgi:hypothetical protein
VSSHDRAATAGIGRLLPPLAGVAVAGSLVARIASRGRYYPGWDLVAATEGYFLSSTRSPGEVLATVLHENRTHSLPFPLYSVLCNLVPGYLERLWPWEYWAHLVTFLLVLLTLWLIVRATGLRGPRRWIVVLAWGASPALLSFSLAGFAWATAFLPHALALCVTLDRTLHRRRALAAVLCLIANETALHVYELGKTVFVVFLGAAVLVRDAPRSARAIWIGAGLLGLYATLARTTSNLFEFTRLHPGGPGVVAALRTVADAVLVSRMVDLPILLVAAVLSFWLFRRDRLFVLAMLLVQMGLVVVLATVGAEAVRPRRYLMVDYYCLVAIACAFREAEPASAHGARGRALLLALLVAGNVWQMGDLVRFVREPRADRGWTMPYTFSQSDYMVPFAEVDWAAEMAQRVERGEKLIVVYNLDAYTENHTNPTGVLERVYLRVGHRRFVDSVFVFGSTTCRYDCLPIRPLAELPDVVDAIRPGGPIDPATVSVYYTQELHRTSRHTFTHESATIFGAIRSRFVLGEASPPGAKFLRFTVAPRTDTGPLDATLERGTVSWAAAASEERSVPWESFPLEYYWVLDEPPPSPFLLAREWNDRPIAIRASGTLHVTAGGRFALLLGSDEPSQLTLDGALVLENAAAGTFQLVQRTVTLAPGWYELEVRDTDQEGIAHLLVDLHDADDDS